MPKIPRFLVENPPALTTKGTAERVSPEAAAQGGQLIQTAGEKLQQIGDRFRQVATFNEQMEAETAVGRGLLDLQQEALTDPNLHQSTGKYLSRGQELVNQSALTIRDPEARATFAAKSLLDLKRTEIAMQQRARKQETIRGQGGVLQALDVNKDRYLQSTNPAERAAILAESKQLIRQALLHELFTPEVVLKLEEQLDSEFPTALAKRDVEIDPEGYLQRDKENFYGSTDIQQRQALQAQARRFLRQQVSEKGAFLERSRDKSVLALIDKLWQGALDQSAVQDYAKNNLLSDEAEQALMRVVESDKAKTAVSDGALYVRLYKQAASSQAAAKERRAAVIEAVAAHAEGRLTRQDVYEIAVDASDGLLKSESSAIRWEHSRDAALQFIAQSAQIAGMGAPFVQSSIQRLRELVPAKTNDPSKWFSAVRQAVEEQLQAVFPATIGRDDVPNAVTNALGTTQRVFEGESKDRADVQFRPSETVSMRHPKGTLLRVPKDRVKDALTDGMILIETSDAD